MRNPHGKHTIIKEIMVDLDTDFIGISEIRDLEDCDPDSHLSKAMQYLDKATEELEAAMEEIEKVIKEESK